VLQLRDSVDFHLDDRVTLVAGSSRGIGLATARAFLAEGSRTVITGRDAGDLTHARAALETEFAPDQVMAFAGDLRDQAVIEMLLTSIDERWGRLDCLVANVGSGRGALGWDLQESEWSRLLEENFSSTYRLVQQVLPVMTQAGQGSIVLVASIAGIEGSSAPLPYSAAKAALVSYGKNVARQVGASNVRVNCVAPGNVLFPGGSWERHLAERRDEVLRQIDAEVPLRRFGQPAEIADVIVFLSSDRAAFITGSCVVVDGGQMRAM
jgi:3-oxoacyl-[acyl-carrier protein] reductase